MATSTSPTTMKKIERAHQLYREGKYGEALGFYTEALSVAKTNPQKIALHSNRAACHLKLHLFDKAAEECTWVLELDHKHTGALMLRAQTLVTLKEYQSALFDVNRLIELNPSSEVYRNLQARLKTQLSLAPIPEVETELEEEEDDDTYEPELNGEEDEDKDKVELKEENEDEDKYDAKVEDKEVEEKNAREEEAGKDGSKCITDASAASLQKANIENVTSDAEAATSLTPKMEKSSDQKSLGGWQTVAKPKGHSRLDYSRWDSVEGDSSEDEEDDDDGCQPRYKFRVKTVGVHAVK